MYSALWNWGGEVNLSIESFRQHCEHNVGSSTAELSRGHFYMTNVQRALRLGGTQGHPQAFADSAKYDCLFKKSISFQTGTSYFSFFFPLFGVCVYVWRAFVCC